MRYDIHYLTPDGTDAMISKNLPARPKPGEKIALVLGKVEVHEVAGRDIYAGREQVTVRTFAQRKQAAINRAYNLIDQVVDDAAAGLSRTGNEKVIRDVLSMLFDEARNMRKED